MRVRGVLWRGAGAAAQRAIHKRRPQNFVGFWTPSPLFMLAKATSTVICFWAPPSQRGRNLKWPYSFWPLHLLDCRALPVRDQQLHHSGAQGGAGPDTLGHLHAAPQPKLHLSHCSDPDLTRPPGSGTMSLASFVVVTSSIVNAVATGAMAKAMMRTRITIWR